MLNLTGYEIQKKIHEGKDTLIYRGIAARDGQPLIFKTVKSSYPSPAEIIRLKKEYEITDRFQNDGVIRALGLTGVPKKPVLILEDFGGIALNETLAKGPLELLEFLPLAIRLAEILRDIHAQNVIHKDVNPTNIVWNRERALIKFIDFGIALKLSREITGIKNPNLLEGTLAYISPEQTGRMNCFLDYRTDYYSLGIIFYQMLAGQLPFDSTDAMEMMHAHIAKTPPALHELNGNIPPVVSAIIQKLMAKNVEERYQSGDGLAADLKRCLLEFQETGSVKEFTPGRVDLSGRFQVPQKLYGREAEIAGLLSAFERASRGDRELMLVSGLPGIGKSVLVNEIQKPIVKLRGIFIAAKYDKFKKDVPYSALLQAFAGLVKYLLGETKERLDYWKRHIREALGVNGRVITDIIPKLELVIGKQAEVPVLGPEESRNRLNLYFQFFIGVFCKAEHPLVLFLDDLQWADHASLEMMKLFLSDRDIKHFFVIGAYRSNEMDETLSLNQVLYDIKKTGTRVNFTVVEPLDLAAITELLQESLHSDPKTTEPLARLLLRKTEGNPFFLGELLKTLYQDGLFQFESGSGWLWDVRKIEDLDVSNQVVELMAAKITGLPEDCGKVLKLGACFGNYFQVENLAEISHRPLSEIQSALDILLEEGLLIKLEDNYNFSHDRIQEAAYSLIPEDERIKEHHRIGQMELEQTPEEKLPEKIFYIVNHLNLAQQLIYSENEQLNLAELNLMAGIKARSAAAYRPALNYLEQALELLGMDSWEKRYELTLKVSQEAVSAAFLRGDYERMEQLAQSVIENARDVLDTVKVYETRISVAIARNELLAALRIGLMILRKLGVNLPENPSKIRILLGLVSVNVTLAARPIPDLVNIPMLEDPRQLAIARLLSSIGSSTFSTMPDLLPPVIFKMLKLSVKYGNSEFSPYSAYAAYGVILCGVLGDIKKGNQFGRLALDLVEKRNMQDCKARTVFVTQCMIKCWQEHLRDTLEPLKAGLRAGMETGDPEFSAYIANTYIGHSFACGVELPGLEKECFQFKGMVVKLNQVYALQQSNMYHQLFLNLLGRSETPYLLKGESYDFDEALPVHLEANDQNNLFTAHFLGCLLSYLFGRNEEALEFASQANSYTDFMLSTSFIPFFKFYESLSQLALYPDVGKSEQKKFLRNVTRNQKKMRHWSFHAPMNFEHKFQLVEAEKARVLGREEKAAEHYEKAVQDARDNRYLVEEAMALELFAEFCLDLGREDTAAGYLKKAHAVYLSWGGLAKVRHLEKTYPHLQFS